MFGRASVVERYRFSDEVKSTELTRSAKLIAAIVVLGVTSLPHHIYRVPLSLGNAFKRIDWLHS